MQHFLFQSGTTHERASAHSFSRTSTRAATTSGCPSWRASCASNRTSPRPRCGAVRRRRRRAAHLRDRGRSSGDHRRRHHAGQSLEHQIRKLEYRRQRSAHAGQWRDGRAYRDGLTLTMRQFGSVRSTARRHARRATRAAGRQLLGRDQPAVLERSRTHRVVRGRHARQFISRLRSRRMGRHCRCPSSGTSGRPARWRATRGAAAAR